MGVARDKTLSDLITAVGGVDTSGLLTDATGVEIKNAILAIVNALSNNNSLVGLTDVNISSPTDGQVLVYDANTQKWINSTGGGSGGILTRLCYSQNGYQANTAIILSETIDNFDLLQFNCIFSTTACLLGSILPVDVFKKCTSGYYIGYFPGIYADIKYISNTSLETLRTNQAYLQSIYGIKL